MAEEAGELRPVGAKRNKLTLELDLAWFDDDVFSPLMAAFQLTSDEQGASRLGRVVECTYITVARRKQEIRGRVGGAPGPRAAQSSTVSLQVRFFGAGHHDTQTGARMDFTEEALLGRRRDWSRQGLAVLGLQSYPFSPLTTRGEGFLRQWKELARRHCIHRSPFQEFAEDMFARWRRKCLFPVATSRVWHLSQEEGCSLSPAPALPRKGRGKQTARRRAEPYPPRAAAGARWGRDGGRAAWQQVKACLSTDGLPWDQEMPAALWDQAGQEKLPGSGDVHQTMSAAWLQILALAEPLEEARRRAQTK